MCIICLVVYSFLQLFSSVRSLRFLLRWALVCRSLGFIPHGTTSLWSFSSRGRPNSRFRTSLCPAQCIQWRCSYCQTFANLWWSGRYRHWLARTYIVLLPPSCGNHAYRLICVCLSAFHLMLWYIVLKRKCNNHSTIWTMRFASFRHGCSHRIEL